jgi:hypothetical protein
LQLGGHAAAEMVGQHGHVALAHAQRGQGDHLEAQAVEQVGAEAALRGHARQVFVGGRHDAHVDPDRAAGADAGDFAIFDRAQQAFLRAHRERAEFVEEQRALVGFLEAARAGAGGAGEGPGLVPEKLGLDQGFGQGAQFIVTSGSCQRADRRWRRSAISSLPVPRSPMTSTGRRMGRRGWRARPRRERRRTGR